MFFERFFKDPESDPLSPTGAAGAVDKGDKGPLDELRARVQAADPPPQAAKAAEAEFARLAATDPQAAEYAVGLNWLEFLAALPWRASTEDNADLPRAEALLEARHYGLAGAKERILEHLAARIMRSRRTRRILVVDDETIARENLALSFGREGHEVRGAADGAEALRMLEEEHYDVVVTDLKMQRLDGIKLLEEIRSRWPEMGVVLITGYATVDSAVEALKKGADHYLAKPVDLAELRKVVQGLLDRRRVLGVSRSPVLCFTGPPGTGKTSIGRAVAESLGRKFIRISLAGLRDEAQLRGHRRTYVGALPGKILSEFKRVGVNNPVFMLDEIDKVGQDFRGDPASVLLEVLDPEQNAAFTDLYLDLPFDLSRTMFIATANVPENLPGPLLDRMELVPFPSYTPAEKRTIAKRFLAPRQLADAGMDEGLVRFTDAALDRIIFEYTREAGLRGLEREIGGTVRKIARQALMQGGTPQPRTVDAADIPGLLGPRRVVREAVGREPRVGVVTGLVWSEAGGEIVYVEAARMAGNGQLILTGSLGDVLRESAQTALSFIRSHAQQLGIAPDFFAHTDLHVHMPLGAVPKDGPSAGATIGTALVSLLSGRPARADTALTGETSLSGRLLPVGGIREKLLAARQAGVARVVLPAGNQTEIDTLEPDVLEGLEVLTAETLLDVLDRALLPAEA